MNPCPELDNLLAADTVAPSDHCDTCRAVSTALVARHADLDRALDAWGAAGDADLAVARALAAASAPTPRRVVGWGSWFHGALLAAATVLVLVLVVVSGGAPPPPPAPAAPIEQQLAAEIAATKEVAALSWSSLGSEDWAVRADALHALAVGVEGRGAVTAEVRPILFALWVQAGRAAENANDPKAPHYGKAGSQTVNIAWYRAAGLAIADRALLESLPPDDLRGSVVYYVDRIADGTLPAPE